MTITISWLILAAVHALPALAFFRPSGLTTLYGIKPDNPLFLLMQHRAALFLAIVVLCLWSAFDPGPRKAAAVATAISMVSFIALYLMADHPKALRTIAVVDLIGLPFLALVTWTAFAG